MSTSGVYNFQLNTYQIIAGALRLLGAIQTGETPPEDEYDDALRALNALTKAWQVNGLHVWTQETTTVDLVVGQAQYTIGLGSGGVEAVRPLRVTEARLQVIATQAVEPLIPMSRLDYANLSFKTSPTGPVAQWFYDPQLPYGVLSIYPAPADTLSRVLMIGQRPLQDFVTQGDTADLPQEWMSALRFALAVELAPEYDCDPERFKMIKLIADEKLAVVQAWDIEAQGTTTHPFSQGIFKLIAGALRLCGGSGPQDVPTFGQINNGYDALNAMTQAWQASGIHVWAEITGTLFLQANQFRYQLGASSPDHATSDQWVQTVTTTNAAAAATSLEISSIGGIDGADQIGVWLDSGVTFWTTVSGTPSGSTVVLSAGLPSAAASGARVVTYTNDLVRPLRVPACVSYQFAIPGGQPISTPMSVLARIDYLQTPNPTTPGITTQFFYDPQLSLGIFNVWPAPSNNQRAVQFTMQRPLNTFTSLSDVPDFPVEWNAALRFNLAVELWPEYTSKRAMVKDAAWDFAGLVAAAQDKLMTAQSWDREPESVYFGVEQMPASRN